jgi:hypothetical protein
VTKDVDEIKQFLDARYVSASEACWRIFGFDMNEQNPHTLRLSVHLEDQQNVLFDDDAILTDTINKNYDTHLTSYLKLNQTDPDAKDLFYYEMPLKYVWNKSTKQWTKIIYECNKNYFI